ncbi:MAG: histidine--tRNA ligase [Candidatus Tyloplasma litorale]|nr:MAG: histidine--tRNA ligase [Mycoplasmatales bacterium]
MIKKIKGTKDYYGNDSLKFQFLIKTLEKISYEYDLEKFITPTFEETQLFSRTVGNESDVVNKEMYTFFDRKNRSISLKPEGTASIVRSIIENKLVYNNEKRNYYYITQMFRYERPQKGRQREFYQFGVERFGEDNSYFDVETILIAKRILDKLSISQYELHINTIGSFEDRNKYNKVLNKFINKKIQILSKYAQEKFHSGNVFRIFDSKDEQDLKILKKAPLIYDFISNESKKRFVELKKILDKLQIKYYVNERLVRGLDYYNDVVFEFISTDEENLGSKSTIIGGGRYNHLINKLDNNIDVPAIGFALGIERLLLASNEFLKLKIEKELDYYIFVIYDEIEMKLKALTISEKLREKGFSVKVNYTNEKISKKYSLAEKEKALNVIVIGKEIYDNEITIKNLKNQKIERKKMEEIL